MVDELHALVQRGQQWWKRMILLEAAGLAIAAPLAYLRLVFWIDNVVHLAVWGRAASNLVFFGIIAWLAYCLAQGSLHRRPNGYGHRESYAQRRNGAGERRDRGRDGRWGEKDRRPHHLARRTQGAADAPGRSSRGHYQITATMLSEGKTVSEVRTTFDVDDAPAETSRVRVDKAMLQYIASGTGGQRPILARGPAGRVPIKSQPASCARSIFGAVFCCRWALCCCWTSTGWCGCCAVLSNLQLQMLLERPRPTRGVTWPGLASHPFQAWDSLSKNSRVSLVVER